MTKKVMHFRSTDRSIMNLTYVQSIPLPWDYKRYIITKYRTMCEHNGTAFAADAFEELFEFVEFYLSKPIRDPRLLRSEFGNRVKHFHYGNRIAQTLRLAMSNPSYVLNLLKISSAVGTTVLEQDALTDYLDELEAIPANNTIPKFIVRYLQEVKAVGHCLNDGGRLLRLYMSQRSHHIGLAAHREYQDWLDYWHTTYLMFKPFSELEIRRAAHDRPPAVVPERYHDYDHENNSSQSFDADTLFLLAGENGLMDGVDPWLLTATAGNAMNAQAQIAFIPTVRGWTNPVHVGRVDLVKKKGTTTFRPIANVNKYLQYGMWPVYQLLTYRAEEHILTLRSGKKIPNTIWQYDASFNQDRFNSWISNRVSNPNLYVASVDLHHATDYLPFSWGEYIIDTLLGCHNYTVDKVRKSFDFSSGNMHKPSDYEMVVWSWLLFKQVSKATFKTSIPERLAQWKNGQPLGALPSFRVLSWTHNVFLEALSWYMGYTHHPYRILGDDLIVSNKKLRNAYIKYMVSNGVKLSLQKSYSGRLVEYAGKRFVANQPPFHTPDQYPYLTKVSLFDWSRASGIPIRYSTLPASMQAWLKRHYGKIGQGYVSQETVSRLSPVQEKKFKSLYKINKIFDYTSILTAMNPTYLQGVPGIVCSDFISGIYPDVIERLERDKNRGHQESGLIKLLGHPIFTQPPVMINKDGWFMRYIPTHIQPWFARKVRPVSTLERLDVSQDSIIKRYCNYPVLVSSFGFGEGQ